MINTIPNIILLIYELPVYDKQYNLIIPINAKYQNNL